jgi:hypothetical protein
LCSSLTERHCSVCLVSHGPHPVAG